MASSMRPIRLVGPAVLVGGLAVLALAVGLGEASVYLVVVVPVIAATGPLAFLGVLLVFVGFFLTFLLWPTLVDRASGEPPTASSVPPQEGPAPARRWGGVVFLGPIPLVFGSNPRMTRSMLLIGVALFVALLALTIYALLA